MKEEYKDFIYNCLSVNKTQIDYIIDLTWKPIEKNVDYYKYPEKYEMIFKNLVYDKYNDNYLFLKKYGFNKKKIKNFKSLLDIINNKKSNTYILFDTISTNNINYYLIMWDIIHKTH